MRAAVALMVLLLCAAGCSGRGVLNSTRHFPPGTGFLTQSMMLDGRERNYAVFIPRSYTPHRRHPAIVFLHGFFESGSDGVKCLSAGLGPRIAENPDPFPFIVIFPHSSGSWAGPDRQRLALATLDAAQRRWSIDPDRVILAGLSFGGRGAYEIGSRYPERFAAIVPVCGPRALDRVEPLTHLPVWAFHNAADPFVPASDSRRMISAINAAGGQAQLTVFPALGHDCWSQALDESDLLHWMLTQRRQPVAGAVSSTGE
jgi:predicted peptidase